MGNAGERETEIYGHSDINGNMFSYLGYYRVDGRVKKVRPEDD